mmetsp:Transcript_27135/g.66916  ORF Transcript_27135/g.66916 Transcript_27135/m.66916 type:complete len:343 (-) Transcript_27135:34-1062(-)
MADDSWRGRKLGGDGRVDNRLAASRGITRARTEYVHYPISHAMSTHHTLGHALSCDPLQFAGTMRGVPMDQFKFEHLRAPERPVSSASRRGSTVSAVSSVASHLSLKITRRAIRNIFIVDTAKMRTETELLASASRPASFGEVDAFISHSWSDDPGAKWDALQTWRSEFVAQYRREPIVWLDRLCIDQTAITESLPLLPVYLAGCNSLLVLAGPTYMQRLWCWVEIFVWLEIGGEARDTVILPLANFSLGDEIDVRRATCYLPEDTDRLLSTVDASTLHGVEAFNGRVRALFVRALFLRESDRSLRSVRSRTRSPSHKLSIGRFSSARDSARPRIGGQIVVE